MKNFLFIAVFSASVVLPLTTLAAFDRNLSYGASGHDVYDLQDLLSESGCLNVSSTGYFGPKTLLAVKCWQTQHSLPSTGYFGILSRTAANDIIVTMTASSTEAEIAETGTTTPVVTSVPVVVPPPQTPAPSPIVQFVPSLPVTLGFTPLVCTTHDPRVGEGNLVYLYKIETDWTRVQSVRFRLDSNFKGSFAGPGTMVRRGDAQTALTLKPVNFQPAVMNFSPVQVVRGDATELPPTPVPPAFGASTPISYTLDAYSGDNLDGQLLASVSGTITEPSCN